MKCRCSIHSSGNAFLITGVGLAILAAILLTLSAAYLPHTVADVQSQSANNTTSTVTFEGTAESTHDALPGHFMHQAIVVLPARVDDKLWVGTISWTSSKPVELRLLYDYNFNLHPDSLHGTPAITQFQLNKTGEVAIALIKPTNVITTGGNYFAGSMPFTAKAVALHNIQGVPFTATYAVDAVAKDMTK